MIICIVILMVDYGVFCVFFIVMIFNEIGKIGLYCNGIYGFIKLLIFNICWMVNFFSIGCFDDEMEFVILI